MINWLLILFAAIASANCLDCGDNSLVKYDKSGLPTSLPWSVLLEVHNRGGRNYCDGVIVSPNHILTYQCRFFENQPVALFFNRKKVPENLFFNVYPFASQRIKQPKWSIVQEYWILTLDKPIKSSKKHAPICIAKNVEENELQKPIYFTWREKQYLDSDRAIWAIIHHSIIKNSPIVPGAVSHLKDNKWYFTGIQKNLPRSFFGMNNNDGMYAAFNETFNLP